MVIRQTVAHELADVLAFYTSCQYTGGAKEDDVIICAEENKKIIGIVRYSIEHDVHMLRGMMVDEKFHRRGVGRRLLEHFDSLVGNQTCYCIPFRHLINFYGIIGFKEVDHQHAPEHLNERLSAYKSRHLNMIIMKRL